MRMRRIIAFLVTAVLVAAGAAAQAEGQKKQAPPNEVKMPFLIAPANKGDTLIGFHYIATKLIAVSPDAAAKVRDKLAFIQDAYVRDVYRAPVGAAADQTTVDKAALCNRLAAIAARIVGPRTVAKVVVLDLKYAPIHPSPGGGLFTPTQNGAPGQANAQENGKNPPKSAAAAASERPATSMPPKEGKH